MTSLILLLIFSVLGMYLLEGNWRAGLLCTIVIGFLQDPIRKITPNQPSQMVGLVLVGFLFSAFVLYTQRGRLNLRAMFWTVPQMQQWGQYYPMLIIAQSINSYLRFSDPLLTAIGAAFYFAPVIGLWVGFQVGCNQTLLRRLFTVYLVASVIFAITVFLDYRGLRSPLLKEVGEGILITFRYGFSAKGAAGLWRTSEIASWHLAAAACLAACFGLSSNNANTRNGMIFLAVAFSFLTIITGRRKALVLVFAFAAIFLLLFSRTANASSRERVITSVLGVAGFTTALYSLFVRNILGEYFGEYVNRTLTTTGQLGERFQGQGVGAILRAIDVSQVLGLGVGIGSQTGNVKLTAARATIKDIGFISEGGGGRLILELGVPGVILLLILGFLLFLTIRRNFRLLKFLPQSMAILMLGLLSFSLANIPSFISAGQLYSDPFVLIMIGLSMGSFLAIPSLVAQQQLLQQQDQLRQAALLQRAQNPRQQALAARASSP
jgi:hypothetical protein